MAWYFGVIDKTLLILTMYAAMFMYSVRIEWKKRKFYYFFLCIAAMAGLVALDEAVIKRYVNGSVFALFFNNGLDIVIVCGCVASMMFLKKYSRAKLLFAGCASYATFYVANNIYSIAVSFLTGPDSIMDGLQEVWKMLILFAAFSLIYAVSYLLCWFVFIKRQRGGIEYLIDKSVFGIFILIFAINIFFGDFDNMNMARLFYVNKILACVLILVVLFVQSKYLNTRAENIKLQYVMEQQKKQFAIAKESIEQVNIKAHDIRHFVEIFRSNGTVPESVISELGNIDREYEGIYDTGCKALDITLAEKCRGFSANNIAFSVIADGAAISFMSDVDVYVLFGNLLENAKEAVLKIDNADNRIIGLHLKRTEQFISLYVENTYAQKPIFENGLPLTSSSDKVRHGFGTKSIQHVVNKYGGEMKMECDDTLFTVDIIFFMQ